MNSKLTVLMVSHEMTPTGAVLSLINLYHGLSARGHAVDLLSLEGGYLASASGAWNKSIWNQSNHFQMMENHPEMYDVILANTIVSDIWLNTQYRAFGPKFSNRIVWYIRELPLDYQSQGRYLYKNMSSRKKMMQLAQSVIFVSHSSKALYEEYYGLLTSKRLRVVNNALNHDLHSIIPCKHQSAMRKMRASARARLRIPSNHTAVRFSVFFF
mmetsp:Transcript_3597/g.7333  ORF Transcript_3597/g.7333 Transcript_3597/m.7333 type:complete len:213 (+) Transcript_3597:3726-4364(+)